MKPILNSKGQPIVLNDRETRICDINQRAINALGYEINVTTLTTIIKKITEQKFFEIAPADYVPVRVGEGAFSARLETFRSFSLGDDFEKGVINTGGNNGRLAMADAGLDSVSIKVINWAKSIGWSLFDLEQAQKSGNLEIVTAKEHARKKNWDLGIQKIAFLGSDSDTAVKGLLTQTGTTTDLTLITKPISAMTGTELKAFVTQILGRYRSAVKFTAWPTHFVIPETDYLGLAGPSSADFPLKSVLQVLEETFQVMCKNKGFKILPLAYADAGNNAEGKQIYSLYNSAEESIRMDIPVDYSNTMANTLDNFTFQNVGYGQYTGVGLYRPLELLYFKY